ncbi:MAG: hypothetical protein SFU91_06850 [Chloroherpetonaceae bacterium]|nr:hypothetical protein [Chloroherpetonaceae bacterium]
MFGKWIGSWDENEEEIWDRLLFHEYSHLETYPSFIHRSVEFKSFSFEFSLILRRIKEEFHLTTIVFNRVVELKRWVKN